MNDKRLRIYLDDHSALMVAEIELIGRCRWCPSNNATFLGCRCPEPIGGSDTNQHEEDQTDNAEIAMSFCQMEGPLHRVAHYPQSFCFTLDDDDPYSILDVSHTG